MTEDDDQEVVGIDIGIAIPSDKTKEAYVAIKVSAKEVFLSVKDAREVAINLSMCADRVEQRNKEEKENGSLQ